MLHVYISYPNPHIAVHGSSSCSDIGKTRKGGQRHVRIDIGSIGTELHRFSAKHYSFGASASLNDLWLSVDCGDATFEDAVVAYVQRLIGQHLIRTVSAHDGARDLGPTWAGAKGGWRATGQPTVPGHSAVIDAVARRDQSRVVLDGLTAANGSWTHNGRASPHHGTDRCAAASDSTGQSADSVPGSGAEPPLLGGPSRHAHRAGSALAPGCAGLGSPRDPPATPTHREQPSPPDYESA